MKKIRCDGLWSGQLLLLALGLLVTVGDGASVTNIDEIYYQKLHKNLNTSVAPCENFYQYACGNYVANYASAEYVDMPGYMEYKVNKQLLSVLQQHNNASELHAKLWRHYESCVNLKAPALNAYLRLVQPQLNFEWPILRQNWNETWQNETQFDWLSTIGRLRRYGLNGVFLTQNVNVRLSNGSHHLLQIHQHVPHLELRHKEVADIFVGFGMTAEESQQVTEQIITLEQQMKNITRVEYVYESADEERKYKDNFQEMTMRQLAMKLPDFHWSKYFELVLAREVNLDTEVVQTFALNVDYYRELLQVLAGTSNETICHYIMLKFMYKMNEDLPVAANKSMPCMKHLRGYLPLATNFLYEQHFYKERRLASDAVLLEIFNRLRTNFEQLVKQNHLELNAAEQQFILAELQTMQLKIGNIPAELTQEYVEDYYSNITISESAFYANHLQLLELNIKQQQYKLSNEPVPAAQQFYEYDPETSSSSSPIKIFDNAVLVPYGYLQLPLFHHALSPLFQYSLFGFILAHEIVHAYDLFHIVYDQYGNYNEMGVAVAQHYTPYIKCLAENASITDSLSENIADDVGLRLVYQTYFADREDNASNSPSSLAFSTADFTREQMFFINSVQFLCADIKKISTMDLKSVDLGHDMHHVRVQQTWANFEKFREAFQCGTTPKECRLW